MQSTPQMRAQGRRRSIASYGRMAGRLATLPRPFTCLVKAEALLNVVNRHSQRLGKVWNLVLDGPAEPIRKTALSESSKSGTDGAESLKVSQRGNSHRQVVEQCAVVRVLAQCLLRRRCRVRVLPLLIQRHQQVSQRELMV